MAVSTLLILGVAFVAVKCVPVEVGHTTKWIDLSYTFDENTIHHPLNGPFEMKTFNRSDQNYWFQTEEISSSTHAGTHLDAPCHFVLNRWAVDDIPFNRLIMVPAAVVNMTQKATEDPDSLLEIADLQQWEVEHGEIPNGAVLMLNTGYAAHVTNNDTNRYFGITGNSTKLHFPGLASSAAQWLVDNRNIYGIGTDTSSIDGGHVKGYPSHVILEDKNIYILENVANVNSLPPTGATLFVIPMKIGKASGAPCRIIASATEVISASGSEIKIDDNSQESES